MQIVLVSGHYPTDIPYTQATRRSVEAYAKRHGYEFYYDDSPVEESQQQKHELHYRRCLTLQKAGEAFPAADWFVWLDSDVFVNRPNTPLQDCLDLTNMDILYHLFHEKPWLFPLNTGVKFVNAKALQYEKEMYSMRNTPPWNEFPFEQKTTVEYLVPKIANRVMIHDPYVLNYILYQVRPTHNDPSEAVFVHMCARTPEQRNKIMEIFEKENRVMHVSEDPTIQLM